MDSLCWEGSLDEQTGHIVASTGELTEVSSALPDIPSFLVMLVDFCGCLRKQISADQNMLGLTHTKKS